MMLSEDTARDDRREPLVADSCNSDTITPRGERGENANNRVVPPPPTASAPAHHSRRPAPAPDRPSQQQRGNHAHTINIQDPNAASLPPNRAQIPQHVTDREALLIRQQQLQYVSFSLFIKIQFRFTARCSADYGPFCVPRLSFVFTSHIVIIIHFKNIQ